ncbi:MAG: hypothetical protein A2402_01735 [Candidatus Staskawiczbacteria bacterium RIFOXYC1_FULL_37_43]|nr:MAG: hypothetical protein A2813_01740 [Candidatus Staskawiczbacteria bacterium RIFCSPHIGHO2_01_FULL_37_17]OGZ72166.1 MAG: hypothetical protein A2891_02085 [Candidatus Staskawiczbacteria bacterium RIFCSPLOWO2_01_FULL_37_19]OGZ75465.1 MAG: hypothetical protein A2205_01660 [Candidatus Staskawiczbacteria bacterium RIFOXYA1_FULL_37_15]OGZ77938.1 MAG: hypothetical protein A2280_02585 [Candidatus Staskawiczbacteria bacterium RIFOXYA12_FULL_37_10]OGZ80453.1 MAG: hypothetical protein A2353_02925 [Can
MKLYDGIKQFNQWRALKVKRIDGYDLDLRQFCIFVGNKEIEDVTIQEIVAWLGWYKKLDFAAWTVLKKAMALRKFFEYYGRMKFDVVDYWLIPMPRKEFTMPRVCTEQTYRQLLSVIPKKSTTYYHLRNRCLINLVWDTGARLGEIVALNTGDLDLKNHSIVIKTEKSRGMRPFRKIPYGKESAVSMRKWMRKRTEIAKERDLPQPEALFIGLKGGSGIAGRRLAMCAAGEIFRKYSNKAGLPYVNAHSLRHHFGTDLAKRGFNNSLISEALGHSQLSSSFQYTQVNNEDLEFALRKRLN